MINWGMLIQVNIIDIFTKIRRFIPNYLSSFDFFNFKIGPKFQTKSHRIVDSFSYKQAHIDPN